MAWQKLNGIIANGLDPQCRGCGKQLQFRAKRGWRGGRDKLERKEAAVPAVAATAFASLESRVLVLPVPPLTAASPSFFRPPVGHPLAALRTRQDVVRQNKPTFQTFRKCHHAHPIRY
jgi:hypothetical protein